MELLISKVQKKAFYGINSIANVDIELLVKLI